jgi:hypothetical protein
MASVPAFEDRGMSIGRVFQRAFSTITHNPIVVLGIAIVVGALPSVIITYVMRSLRAGDPNTDLSRIWGTMVITWVLAVIIGAIVQGALTRAVAAENEGQRASFADCVATALRVLLPLLGVGFIYGLAIGVGFILLIVPGIIVMLIWSVAGPAVVVERNGVMMALSRSAELTKGARWKIFGLFLVLLVIYILVFTVLVTLGLGGASAASAGGPTASNLVGSAITAITFNLLWGTIQPSLYVELRQWKEGGSIENLQEVFA